MKYKFLSFSQYFDRVENSVYALLRTRDMAISRYKEFGIPVDWLLDSGVVGKVWFKLYKYFPFWLIVRFALKCFLKFLIKNIYCIMEVAMSQQQDVRKWFSNVQPLMAICCNARQMLACIMLQISDIAFSPFQIKLSSVQLARKYMKRVALELDAMSGPEKEPNREFLVLQGVRFAFRVHQVLYILYLSLC
jgi:hypothetical protein